MRWQMGRRSTNVEDRRGIRAPQLGGIGCLGLAIVIAIAYFTGSNPLELLQQVGTDTSVSTQAPSATPGNNDPEREFIEVVLGSTEDVWTQVFAAASRRYQPPKLALFSDAVSSACGFNSAAVGPFIARRINMFIWISRSSTSSTAGLERPGTSRRRTSSPMKWDITFKTCLEFRMRLTG